MNSQPADELATVINNFLPSYNTENKLPAYKLRTLNALQKCRTEYMGGHIEACQECGELRVAYNSCRNRHCPKCGAIEKERWVMNKEADLLPVRYFHVALWLSFKCIQDKVAGDNQGFPKCRRSTGIDNKKTMAKIE